jgi:hypothetical protein
MGLQNRWLPVRSGREAMWKSVFLAAGIFACILGVELLLIDSAVLVPLGGNGDTTAFRAPDWMPWTMLTVGAATILHFCQLPRLGGSAHPPLQRHY